VSKAISSDEFRSGMRHLAGAVSIIATSCDGRRYGMTATAVNSLAAEPPTLIVCVNKSASVHLPITNSQRFCVNVLDESDVALARQFSSSSEEARVRRFQDGEWAALVTGAPVLATSRVSFDCMLIDSMESGTHTVFIGVVQAIRVGDSGNALIYLDGQFGGYSASPALRTRCDQRLPNPESQSS
jgi:flavin reductase